MIEPHAGTSYPRRGRADDGLEHARYCKMKNIRTVDERRVVKRIESGVA
jgi:hypothetical protein